MAALLGIPDQPRVERHRGEHRDDHHGGEADRADARLDRRERSGFTSATRIEIMKMSTIDQRPTCSMIRYIRLRSRSRHRERRCVVIRRKVSPISFSTGTVMLAKNTRCHRPHAGADQRLDARTGWCRARRGRNGSQSSRAAGWLARTGSPRSRSAPRCARCCWACAGTWRRRSAAMRRGPRGRRRHQSQLVAVVTADQTHRRQQSCRAEACGPRRRQISCGSSAASAAIIT